MKLSSLAHGRDNNFNLIRIVAALAVLISHSFTLALGPGDYEPIRQILGMTLGVIGVDLFFITSGFLVTASLLTRQNAIEFTWARALRIFPGLVVMLVLTVFVLGVIFTALPLPSYFGDSETYFYLVKCATLITGVAYALPGVFEGNPFKRVPGISVLALLLISASATLLLGALSWHLIERRSLGLKGLYVDHTVRLADTSTPTR